MPPYSEIALFALTLWFISLSIFFGFKYFKLKDELSALKEKFRANPSYETQLFMADMLRNGSLFHIERIAPEDVLIRRG